MKIIHYAGEELMTGDAVADAVVQYAEALAKHETSASIDVPVVTSAGTVVNASFLLGPASQLIAVPTDSPLVEPLSPEFLALVESELQRLGGNPGYQLDPDDASARVYEVWEQ